MTTSADGDSFEVDLDEAVDAPRPRALASWSFARKIVPIYELVRALFGQNKLETGLRLMLLYELTQLRGRFDKSRIRSAMPYVPEEKVDRLAEALYRGGWLQLRASDQTYQLSSTGLQLLAVLHAADLSSLSPDNVLSRAAQNAEFGATLDGAEETTGYLLDQLLDILQRQVDEAKNVLQKGRPFRLIEWSRRNHKRQLDIIRGVLNALEEKLDGASEEFRRVVQIHERMQSVVRLQTGINDRLREWNLEQLYTSEAGYSIPQLVEAVLGADDDTLERTVHEDILQVPQLPPTLTTPEIRSRFHAARRSLPSQQETYTYEEPEEAESEPLESSALDMAGRLRLRLTELFEGRTPSDPPLPPDQWLESEALPGIAFELAMLSRLETDGGYIALEDGRRVQTSLPDDIPSQLSPNDLLEQLAELGLFVRRQGSWVCRVTIFVADDEPSSPDSNEQTEQEEDGQQLADIQ